MLSPLSASFGLIRSYLGLSSPEDLEEPESPYAVRRDAPWSAPSLAQRNTPAHDPALSPPRLAKMFAPGGHTRVENMKEKVKFAIGQPLKSPHDPGRRMTMQKSSWADGLRGIASVYVVASHITLCVARRIVLPCCINDQTNSPLLFQRPIFRLVAQGHSWVALFFVLLGFVNALKPIKLSRAGQHETALANLAVSSFRRTFRLVLPATAAVLVSWFVCQMGLYETARNGDAYWLYTYTPMQSESWFAAVRDLFTALRGTWYFKTENIYDQPQWALIHLLQGSVMVFTVLLMTVKLTPLWRSVLMVVMMMWSLNLSQTLADPLVGFTVFGGIGLAEMALSDVPYYLSNISPVLSPPLIVAALVMMSYPTSFVDRAPWSRWMLEFGTRHLPQGLQGDMSRSWGSLGSLLLVFAVLISPHARRLLSGRALTWLGKVSFPIYLLHGTFLRTVFAWLAFTDEVKEMEVDAMGGGRVVIERYAQGGVARIWLAIVVSMGLMLVASHFWAKKIEPYFGHITKFLEDIMTGKATVASSWHALSSSSSSSSVSFPSAASHGLHHHASGMTAVNDNGIGNGSLAAGGGMNGGGVLPTHRAAPHSE